MLEVHPLEYEEKQLLSVYQDPSDLGAGRAFHELVKLTLF